MADEVSQVGLVVLYAKLVVHHWQEFGPDAEFARVIEALDAALQQWSRTPGEEESHG